MSSEWIASNASGTNPAVNAELDYRREQLQAARPRRRRRNWSAARVYHASQSSDYARMRVTSLVPHPR